jgi:hypothetical protein
LPPDEQKLTRRPDAKVLSDKDRIATSKTPQINHEELKKLLQSAHPGQPGTHIPAPPAPGQPPPQVAQSQQPPTPQESQQGITPPQDNNQTAQLQTPPQNRPVPNFNTPLTAGSAIEQAERAAAEDDEQDEESIESADEDVAIVGGGVGFGARVFGGRRGVFDNGLGGGGGRGGCGGCGCGLRVEDGQRESDER